MNIYGQGVYNLSGGTLDVDVIDLMGGDATFNDTSGTSLTGVSYIRVRGPDATLNIENTAGACIISYI